MLTAAELGQYIDQRLTMAAFRLELLASYNVESERQEYERFLRGEPVTAMAKRRPWLDRLRAEAQAGIRNQRVHVLRTPLTPYLRFECGWGYFHNAAAGEDIRIIDLAEQALPAGLPEHDFWLIDDRHAITMHYSDDGQFLGAEPAAPGALPTYQRGRDVALAAAEPFGAWWQRHTEEWREHGAV